MIKNKRSIIILIAAVLIVAGGFSYIAFATDSGTSSDPLVTLSYIEKKVVPGIMSDVNTLIDKKLADFKSTLGQTATQTPAPSSGNSSYVVVMVKTGQTLLADGEGTEIILRSGEASVVAPLQNQGLSNVTEGKDALANEKLIKNNLYIIPRADGRGVKASAECYFMVRGAFKIVS